MPFNVKEIIRIEVYQGDIIPKILSLFKGNDLQFDSFETCLRFRYGFGLN